MPPNRFEMFTEQNYIFPTPKGERQGKGKAADEYDATPWNENENPEGGEDMTGPTEKLLQEVTSWIDQYVMEVNVGPLLKTVDKRIESQVKRSFRQQWRPFSTTYEEKTTE